MYLVMSFNYNNISRSLTIVVNLTIGGAQQQGYPKTYNGRLGDWNPSYAALTDSEFARLTDSEFTARMSAFEAYVESLETGLDLGTDMNGDGFVKTDINCLPLTTTTTTAAATTTTTVAPTTTTTTAAT